jgi:hypothetical protein
MAKSLNQIWRKSGKKEPFKIFAEKYNNSMKKRNARGVTINDTLTSNTGVLPSDIENTQTPILSQTNTNASVSVKPKENKSSIILKVAAISALVIGVYLLIKKEN